MWKRCFLVLIASNFNSFQSLIGSVETVLKNLTKISASAFQSLIGSVETVLRWSNNRWFWFVSISDR